MWSVHPAPLPDLELVEATGQDAPVTLGFMVAATYCLSFTLQKRSLQMADF